MKWMARLVTAGVGALALMVIFGGAGSTAQAAASGTVYVGIPGLGCPNTGNFMMDLQTAIDSTPQPKQVIVCTLNDAPISFDPIHIDNKLNMKLIAKGMVLIVPPDNGDPEPVFTGALVAVNNSTNVTIQGFWVDGDDFLAAGQNGGIVFTNSSGTITKNHIVGIRQSSELDIPDPSPYTSIWVGGNGGLKVSITSNTIADYEVMGIYATGNVKLTISKNLILGDALPLSSEIPQAILLESVTGGTISGNRIQDKFSFYMLNLSAGIQLYATSGVKVTKNTITDTAFGISIYADGDPLSPGSSNSNVISGNKLYGVPQGITVEAVDDSVDAQTSVDVQANLNKITGNTLTVHTLQSIVGIGIAEEQDVATTFIATAILNTVSGNKLYGYCGCLAVDVDPFVNTVKKNTIAPAPTGAGAAAAAAAAPSLPDLKHHYQFESWD